MRERVASTGSLGSVPFRSVSFRRQKTFLSSFVRMSVRLFAVHDPSVHDPFFVFVVESRLRARSVPALHCATRPRRRRSIDRSIMSKRSRLEVGIAATDRGVYEDDAETEDEPRSGDGDSFRDSFRFPRSFPFPFPPAGARSIRSLCRSSTPPRRRVNGDDGLFSIDDAGREEGEKTDATRRDPPRSGVGFACERRMDLADGTDRRMRIYTSFET